MAFATVLSLAAHFRIKWARGALRGETVAHLAIIISVLWWVLLVGLYLFWVIAVATSR